MTRAHATFANAENRSIKKEQKATRALTRKHLQTIKLRACMRWTRDAIYTARRIPAPYGHSRATYEPQHTVLKECDDHHEAAEGDGAHVLPVNERVLKKLSVAAHVKADRSLHLVGNALKMRMLKVIKRKMKSA